MSASAPNFSASASILANFSQPGRKKEPPWASSIIVSSPLCDLKPCRSLSLGFLPSISHWRKTLHSFKTTTEPLPVSLQFCSPLSLSSISLPFFPVNILKNFWYSRCFQALPSYLSFDPQKCDFCSLHWDCFSLRSPMIDFSI